MIKQIISQRLEECHFARINPSSRKNNLIFRKKRQRLLVQKSKEMV